MIIAVDFDGTIVERSHPELGKEIPFAIESLKLLQQQGHLLILWTSRAGKELDEAVEYCRSNDLQFYAINKNYPEEIFDENISRKIKAEIYIDDRNFGQLPDWGRIYFDIVGDNLTRTSFSPKKGIIGLRRFLRRILS